MPHNSSPGTLLLDSLGPMRVINLPARADRRRDFASSLATLGLTTTDPRVSFFPAIRPQDPGCFPSIGARGCFLSHLELLREARSAGNDSLIVCEDDLDFAPDCSERLPEALRQLDSTEWQILYAGHYDLPSGLGIGGSNAVAPLGPCHRVRGTHFLVYRREAISLLVDYLENMMTREAGDPAGGPMHVDGALNHFRLDHPDVRVIAAIPPLGVQRSSRTDIHPTRWFDRVPLIRDVATLARRALRPQL